MIPGMTFYRPETLQEALALKSDGVRILAGGTDIYPALRDAPVDFPVLDTTAITALRHISRDGQYWSFGANSTWTDILRAELPPAFDGLKLAAREVGSIQIQNRGTLAGNICNASPAADGVPPLLTLDAQAEIQSSKGMRREAIASFIRGNRKTSLAADEMVTRILVPEECGKGIAHFLKLGARKYLVISIAMVAIRLVAEDNRIGAAAIAVGACSEAARRIPDVEQALIGLNQAQFKQFAVLPRMLSSLSPIDDVRAPRSYRLEAAAALITDCLSAAAEIK
jgi:CO/xanthine dehydrogenase FAD-binding subunit